MLSGVRQVLRPICAAALLVTSPGQGAVPEICGRDSSPAADAPRAPKAVAEYVRTLGNAHFNQRAACAKWAGTFSGRHELSAPDAHAGQVLPPNLILFSAPGIRQRHFVDWLKQTGYVRHIEQARHFVVVRFSRYMPTHRLVELLDSPQVAYAEPDCDGPDFLTTSTTPDLMQPMTSDCWTRAARKTFPNDPCMDDLWGHAKIGWDSSIAAHSLPRVVAVLDSGIDAAHEDLSLAVVLRMAGHDPPRSQGSYLNAKCATSGRCYPHGTEMAGTIGGRMDNGIGLAGVAPNSRLLPIVISRVDRGLLGRLSTIAEGIDAAV